MKKFTWILCLIFGFAILVSGCGATNIVPTYNMVDYTVYHYFQDVNGVYSSEGLITEKFSARVGSAVTATPKTVEFFTYKASSSSVSGTQTEAGISLYMYYTRNIYVIHFIDSVSGDKQMSAFFGRTITLPMPQADGKTFKGWTYTNGGDDFASLTAMPTCNLNLYAVWQVNG